MISSLLWRGSPKSSLLLERLLTQSQGRLIIIHGEKGIGKTTLVLLTLSHLYGEHFIFSQNFQFFRPDHYDMKLAYYLKYASSSSSQHLFLWGVQFLHHLSQLIYLKEIKNSTLKYHQENLSIDEFRALFQDYLQQKNFVAKFFENQDLQKVIISLAETISSKTHVPIAFIQEVLHFHQYKSDIPRVTFIGNWENATVEAQNASLKLFEEMPPSSRIILHTNNIEKVLPTIISRSILINLPPLSPTHVREILNIPESNFQSCFQQMREILFYEKQNAMRMAEEFFSDIAFQVQQGTTIFSFIEKISADENFTSTFLEALENNLRKFWLSHQEKIRSISLTNFQPTPAKFHVFTSEIKYWIREIQNTKQLLENTQLRPTYLLTDLLINLARWVQKRKKA